MMPSHAGAWSLVALALAGLAAAASCGDDPKKPMPDDDPYGWEEPLALHRRGERYWFGRFDGNGNFIPHPKHGSLHRPPASGPFFYWDTTTLNGNFLKYEHRSDRFIRGMIVKTGLFVPEIGSTVLDRNEVYLDKLDAMVWNLRESRAAFWTPEREKQFPRGVPSEPDPPKAGVPKGWELVPFEKLYPDRPPRFARVIGDVVEFGQLGPEGEFLPADDLPIVSRSGIKSPVPFGTRNLRYYTLPRLDEGRKETAEKAYEYRSGRLVKGKLQDSGNFVPEVGSKVLDFKDYTPGRDLRVYNLPGELRRTK
jgi:hypothetical protein